MCSMSSGNDDQKTKLLKIMQDVIQHDNALREKYQMGEKFRFIRDRLHGLLAKVEDELSIQQQENDSRSDVILENEVVIYIYLYNAQGQLFQTWHKLLNPSVFYEYSVNRPIYTEKADVEAFIRHKKNPTHHAYLAVAVLKEHVLNAEPLQKDALGQPLIKVKEGSLKINRLMGFHHSGDEYTLDENNQLQKKIL